MTDTTRSNASKMDSNRQHVIAIIFVIVASLFYTLMVAIPKFAAGPVSPIHVAFIRFISALAILIPIYLATNKKRVERPALDMRIYAARAALAILMLSLTIFAVVNAPLIVVQIILMTNGISAVFIAWILLKEPLGKRQLTALLVVVIGAMIVSGYHVEPEVNNINNSSIIIGVIAAVLASVAWGAEVVFTRSIAKRDDPVRLVTMITLFGALILLPIVVFLPINNLSINDFFLFCLVGICAAAGQLLSAAALSRITTIQATPYRYSSIPFALIMGVFIFGEKASLGQLVGLGVILIGILITIFGMKTK